MKVLSIKEAATRLRDGQSILAIFNDGIAILCDARNNEALKKAFDMSGQERATVLCGSDAQINAVVQEVPALAWDIIDASEKDTVLILPDGMNVSKNLLNKDGGLAIRWCFAEDVRRLLGICGKAMAAVPLFRDNDERALDDLDIDESILDNIEYLITLDTPATLAAPPSIPVISLGLDGTIRIISE